MDILKYVDVFHGCGERALPEPKGVAATWFFLKAQTGNTSPAAALPFGKLSAGPFSGGYPTGYGDHLLNCAGRPGRFEGGKRLLGFSHLCHSGTGAVGYYYNYAVVSPGRGGRRFALSSERAGPGFYAADLEGTLCELTVEPGRALHRYTFQGSGSLTVDFSNDGLTEDHGRHRPEGLEVFVIDGRTAAASGVFQGVRLFMAARCFLPCAVSLWEDGERRGAEFALSGKNALLAVAISAQSMENALAALGADANFDSARRNAARAWEAALSRVKIEADERTKRIFYSNLYHSLVKPADWSGDGFVYGGDGPFMTDFITLWDMYKTQLPLVFTLYEEPSHRIAETLMRLEETLGFLPNSLGLSDNFAHENVQARALGAYALLSAYHHGHIGDPARMLRAIEGDIFSPGKRDFTQEHRCKSHTWTLDMADACAYAAQVAQKEGLPALASRLAPLGELWKTAYDAGTGLLLADSEYYEGTLYNYSFRPCAYMEERVALCGGAERFAALLDDFFGFGAPRVTQPTDPRGGKPIEDGMRLGRFEGFNNEPDMETPYSYIFAGRHDRTCEVVSAGMKYMFSEGRGGLPGNNDSGGLSSCYVWNALGLFPVAGRDLFLIGSPRAERALLKLASGRALEITVSNGSEENIYVKSAFFNGEELPDFRLPASALMGGGRLEFEMGGKK